MSDAPCRICADADRDFGNLIASGGSWPSGIPQTVKMAAYNSLIPWVDHVRQLSSSAQAHVDALNLPTLSGTAYVGNVLKTDRGPTLRSQPIFTSNRAAQNQVIAAALVLSVSDVHIFAPGTVQDEPAVKIAGSWGGPARGKV